MNIAKPWGENEGKWWEKPSGGKAGNEPGKKKRMLRFLSLSPPPFFLAAFPSLKVLFSTIEQRIKEGGRRISCFMQRGG